MDKSHEVNAFCNGIVVGINLYQQKVVTAQKNNEAIKIGGELYYIQSAKYDEKTQSVTIKYTPADMSDYDRMMKYLEKTGKSRSSFIKELINDFFENEKYEITESRIADYYKIYNVDGELLDKLKAVVGEEKYNIILDILKTFVEDELYDAYIYKGDDVDIWIEDFMDEIKNGDVDINVSDKEFEKIIDKSLSHNLKSVFYG